MLNGKNIRTLTASEIECRVGTVVQSNHSVTILLYKDARCDMAILDEVVGPMNWQRDHKELKGVIYCGVGLRDKDGNLVWKWDAGTESNTEPQKGEASDSFKRACVNWGIGRELYTAPTIFIPCNDTEWNGGKPRIYLKVAEIAYDEQRNITALKLTDRNGAVRFDMNAKKAARTATKKPAETSPQEAPEAPQKGVYTPVSEEDYWKAVEAAVLGKISKKSGLPMLEAWALETNAGPNEIADFKRAMEDVAAAKGISITKK